jgi:hypothetical protein
LVAFKAVGGSEYAVIGPEEEVSGMAKGEQTELEGENAFATSPVIIGDVAAEVIAERSPEKKGLGLAIDMS